MPGLSYRRYQRRRVRGGIKPICARLFVEAVFGNENGDGFADYLGGGVAKDRLSARVPARDHTVEILADDGVIGGLDNRVEEFS